MIEQISITPSCASVDQDERRVFRLSSRRQLSLSGVWHSNSVSDKMWAHLLRHVSYQLVREWKGDLPQVSTTSDSLEPNPNLL